VDLDTLAEVCRAVNIPVIGNGGIAKKQDAEQMMQKTGCRRVAIGQAARGNPWIFKSMVAKEKTPLLEERIAVCKRHLELYVDWAGEHRAAREMRKHASWYLKGFPGAAALRNQITTAVDVPSYHKIFESLLETSCR
jgi:tRNA-dihydrouridine synthase